MTIEWTDSLDTLDWHELVALYQAVPLGNKRMRTAMAIFENQALALERGHVDDS